MVKDEDVYPVDTVVRLHKTGEFALIVDRTFLKDGKNFLHYLAKIEGRGDHMYAVYHEEVDLEALPK
jgi:hypothetical protein